MTTYTAVALQTACRAVTGCAEVAEARQRIAANIARLAGQVRSALSWTGGDTRLVVLPEYVLTGFPARETAEEWIEKACLSDRCAEWDALSAIACETGIFLAGNAYETDAGFPGLYFQTSFVIDPAGEIVLRYRRLNSMYTPTPHDVWDRYLDLYGLDAVFPVARTEIGNLAAVASEEILFPEVARCMAMRGAEVLVHSTCQVGSPRPTPKTVARLARASENLLYVVSANTAGMEGSGIAGASADGGSAIVDYRGRVLAEAGQGESVVAAAQIDLAGLRRWRRRPGMENLLARQRFEAYAESYRRAAFYPANSLAGGHGGRGRFLEVQEETIERLAKAGLI